MANALIVILSIIGSLIFITVLILLIVYFYHKHGKLEESPINRPWILNLTGQGSNFLYQELKSEIKESGNRNNTVICKSFEIQLDKDKNPILPKKALEPICITTQKNRRIAFARGTLDEDSEVLLYLPENLNNVDASFKNTKLYRLIEPLIFQNDALDNTIRSYVTANQKNKDVIDMLLASNIDDKVIQKLKIIKNTMNEAEQGVTEQGQQ